MKIKGKRGADGLYDVRVKDKIFKFPSVTRIIGTMKNPELDNLKMDIGDPKEFGKITRRAANRGSVMHLFLENYSIGLKHGMTRDEALLYTQKTTNKEIEEQYTDYEKETGLDLFYNLYHSPFVEQMKKPLLIEGLMVSFEFEYAGRTDIVYNDRSIEIVLGDYKSSSGIVLEGTTKYIKYKLQLAAYWNAFEETRKHRIKEAIIWVSHPTGYQRIVLTKQEYPIYLEYFLKLRRAY